MNTIVYTYRGEVERGTGRGYRWRPAYSETVNGAIVYPWMTRRECQEDARARGARTTFKHDSTRTKAN